MKQKLEEIEEIKHKLKYDINNDKFLEMQNKIVNLENQLTEERNQALMNENKIAEVEASKSKFLVLIGIDKELRIHKEEIEIAKRRIQLLEDQVSGNDNEASIC